MTREEAKKIFGELLLFGKAPCKKEELEDLCKVVLTALEQEPTTKNDLGVDCISRQAVLELIADYDLSMGQVVKGIHALPPVTPQPRKGHWIAFDSDEDKYDEIKCDCCKKEFTVDAYHWTDIGFTKDDLNFCPNCGADMREVEE